MSNDENTKLEECKKFVGNIQLRARNNAFAHREASADARKKADFFTYLNISFTAAALLFTSLSPATKHYVIFLPKFMTDAPLPADEFYNFLAIISAFIALVTQCVLLYKHYDTTETMHSYFQNSFQYISQRSREIHRPGYDSNNIDQLIDELERNFTLLKSRAIEPEDRHFDIAASLQDKIKSDKKYEGARTNDVASE